MSYEVWVQRFDRGQPVGLSAAVFTEVFGPYVTGSQPQFHFHQLVAADGGEADIYANRSPPFDSLTAARLSPGDVCELLVRFAYRCDAVILLPGGVAVLTSPAQREHLPVEIRDGVRLATGGVDLQTAIGEA